MSCIHQSRRIIGTYQLLFKIFQGRESQQSAAPCTELLPSLGDRTCLGLPAVCTHPSMRGTRKIQSLEVILLAGEYRLVCQMWISAHPASFTGCPVAFNQAGVLVSFNILGIYLFIGGTEAYVCEKSFSYAAGASPGRYSGIVKGVDYCHMLDVPDNTENITTHEKLPSDLWQE